MLIAVSANNSNADSQLDPRFGRAAGFMIFNSETDDFHYIDNNGNSQLAQGAGIQTAQLLAEMGVGAVISGTFGPKAEAALQKGGIQMITSSGTVRAAVETFLGKDSTSTVDPAADTQQSQMGEGPGTSGGCRRTGGGGRGMGGGGRGTGGGGRGMGGGGRGTGGGGRGTGGGGSGMGGGGRGTGGGGRGMGGNS